MSILGGGGGGGMGMKLGGKDPYTSAYMLQYVRKDHFEACVSRVPQEAIPPHIAQRFHEEEQERDRRRLEKQDAHLYLYVKVFDDADLAAHAHFDLMDFERVRTDRVFRVLKAATVRAFKEQHLLKAFDVDQPDKLRLRQFTRRKNQTIRASRIVENEGEELAKLQNKDNIDSLRFLVEVSGRSAAPFFDPVSDTECQVFFKFYDPVARKLQFVTRLMMAKTDKPLMVEAQLRKLASVAPDAPLLYWEEVRWDVLRIDPIDPAKTLAELELQNGDIIVFQTVLPGHALADANQDLGQGQLSQSGRAIGAVEMEIPWAKQYFVFLQESISVKFKRLKDWETDPGFTIMCIKSNTYNEVQDLVAKHLPRDVCADPRRIEFTGHSTYSSRPLYNGEIPYDPSITLVKMLQRSMYSSALADTIYYTVQPFTLDEMKQKLAVVPQVLNLKQAVLFHGKTLVDKAATVAQMLQELRPLCSPPIPEEQGLRLLGVSFHKVHSVIKPTEPVASVTRGQLDLVVEFVAPEETAPDRTGRLVPCVHGEYEYFIHPYGNPFMLWISKKETVASVRARLAKRLELPPEEIAKWKIGVVEHGFSTGLKLANDSDALDPEKWTDTTYLALIHQNKKKESWMRQEGIVIREQEKK